MPTWILASFIAEQITPNSVASNCTSYSCPLCGFCEWGFGSDSWAGLAWCSCCGSVQCRLELNHSHQWKGQLWRKSVRQLATWCGLSQGEISSCPGVLSLDLFKDFAWWLAPAGKGNPRNWGTKSWFCVKAFLQFWTSQREGSWKSSWY